MEAGAQAPGWDGDDTVVEGSVTDSEPEEDALPWRRLLFDEDTSPRVESSFHQCIRTVYEGLPSPEIPLRFKLCKDPQKQVNKNTMMPVPSEGTISQQPPGGAGRIQALLQSSCAPLAVPFPQAVLPLNHGSIGGPVAESPEVLLHPEENLSEDTDSPEVSLFSGAAIAVPDAVKTSSVEPEKIFAASDPLPECGSKQVLLTVTREENSDEGSSLETFVSALESKASPGSGWEERLLELSEIKKDADPGDLLSPLSDSLSSVPLPLTAWMACSGDLPQGTERAALPAELLAALNASSEARVGPICRGEEEGGSLSAGDQSVEVELDEDCTQVAGVNLESRCYTPSEQGFKLIEQQDKRLTAVKTLEDPNSCGLQTSAHQKVTSCEPLNSKGNSDPVEDGSDQDAPRVLRRSSRLEKLKVIREAKPSADTCDMPEDILPKTRGGEDRINQCSTKNFRMQDLALIRGKRRDTHLSRFQSGWVRKNERFGERKGWTALHEASLGGYYQVARELLKGGADVNIKGLCQITPLHDAVINGHHKVAELLLLNGANPLHRNDNGKCALDEARDISMHRLLERYVPKLKKCLRSAQRSGIFSSAVENVQQCQEPKFNSESHSSLVCIENSNKQKPECLKFDKGSKEGLFMNEDDTYGHYHKDSTDTIFGKAKHEQSTLNQIHSTGLRSNRLHNGKDSSTEVSKGKGIKSSQHKMTQVDDGDFSPRKALAVSCSKRVKRLVTPQQHGLYNSDPDGPHGLPGEPQEPSSPAQSGLKNGVGNNIEACSFSKETYIQNLDLSKSQESQFLELKPSDQTKGISFSGIALNKETELPLVTTDSQPPTGQEQHRSPSEFHENNNSSQKDESLNKWESSFLSFVKRTLDDGGGDDGGGVCTSEKAVTAKMVVCSTDYNNQYKETRTNREEMDFQPFLPSADHFPQENELNADSLTTLPQQEAIIFCDSDKMVISEQHVANYGSSFDHSHGNSEQMSLTCLRTDEASQLTIPVEPSREPQNCSPRAPDPLMSQTVTCVVENKQDAERNCTDGGQNANSSSGPSSAVISSQMIQATEVEKMGAGLLESETMRSPDFHSNDSVNKQLNYVQQLSQREEKESFHKPGRELTNISGDEGAVRNSEKKREEANSEMHMPTNCQEHNKVWNLRKTPRFLSSTSNQAFGRKEASVLLGKFPEKKTAGINKRNARGESRLHLAARRGNLSLVKTLIDSGANVNLKDHAGWTPLHEASQKGCSDVIIELLNAGANVNCGNLDGILPLHDAVANSHLQAAEILLQHGADPNQKHHNKKTALDEAGDEGMRELLRSYGAVETENTDGGNAVVTVKSPAVRSKRQKRCFCDGSPVDPPSHSCQEKTRERLPMHQTISAILQDIEEKQEMLLDFEIRNQEDAEQYIEKMLEIKEVVDDVLARQKAERDDLAKKYRVSIESFKQGALREQLTNLATRQKDLLVVAKKQKKISLKIQSYKNDTSLSGLGLRKPASTSEISSERDNQELTSLENSVQPQSDTPDTLETGVGSQNTRFCPNSEAVRREEFFANEVHPEQSVRDGSLDILSESRHSDGPEKTGSPSQPAAAVAPLESSQRENDLPEAAASGRELYSASAEAGTSWISEAAGGPARNVAYPSTVRWAEDLSTRESQQGNKTTTFQQPPWATSKSLAHPGAVASGGDVHPAGPALKPAAAAPQTNDCHIPSGAGEQHIIKRPVNPGTAPRKKCVQIKDLMSLGRIHPGVNILEFKTQDSTHKASILLSGKIEVENGQIYQNPVSWIKDLLGGGSYVTWNYAWSKVTYLGKQLLKYVSEEVPSPPRPPQTHLPGTSRESTESIPCYLQINEILLISDQEFLPCHIMDQHWKFYAECEELTF
ncbi:ankyrin repeat domain-containing protein 31 isoform X2 [Lepus europaeus]|uniref:ankyrin repeat domain-containing protein 31 isoform X2 n=1 Tax=Lepus europaeus TaxID=9983 RepID=UPI002B46B472|nr:ankyrin repeat domain-containing protein 31 isoform X2 [Lepus europaeus]